MREFFRGLIFVAALFGLARGCEHVSHAQNNAYKIYQIKSGNTVITQRPTTWKFPGGCTVTSAIFDFTSCLASAGGAFVQLQATPTTPQTGSIFLTNNIASGILIGTLLSAGSITIGGGSAPLPGVRNINGSEGAPAFSFTLSNGTGMWWDSAQGRLRFSVNNTGRLDVGSFGISVNGGSGTTYTGTIDEGNNGPLNIGGSLASEVGLGSATAPVKMKGTVQNFIAGNETATVGAAGGAQVLPGSPLGYLSIKLASGSTVKIPYYSP